ncbi:RNA-binding S4 domain-containing protein [Thermoflavimicrobium dichotomicum]|uniref:RQC P-site tRNA stabilizing factor n=1 Tax=Thermoflavimicrobium dichotomicum TaxID=46223 RepID=A0A1I3QQY1_9BACL|nr:RNA-binding S4 domain-containing protein [Thermoflavimicrobium dichotomicum]SFJ35691.1 Ribosomal 50S subunit-recycling heat shock protein, contains S4 domain [Thermoflavimicrobium dichotomicum]
MRLDKFLKVSRLIKRRTLAKEVCDQGRVMINGKPAKAGVNVSVGDELSIRFGNKTVTVRVEKIAENVRKEEAGAMFTLIQEEVKESDSDVLSS